MLRCRKHHFLIAASLSASLIMSAPGCTSSGGHRTGVNVPEIRPGVAAGYLQADEMPDSTRLLPPPPAPGTAAFAADVEASELRHLKGSARWEQARQDSILKFPEAAGIFECALDAPVSESETPNLYALLRRSRTDGAVVSDAAKARYQRPRPFMHNHDALCTPEKQEELAKNGSYPSGHTSIGWTWALILSEVAPWRADEVLARGRSYGMSRVVCNAHWKSDVTEGRFMGASVVARLHGNPEFRSDVAAARRELEALRDRGAKPARDCAAERRALGNGDG